MQIGVQSKNIIYDENPEEGFELLKEVGFSCIDFSLNKYLSNLDIYSKDINSFFNTSIQGLKQYFTPHKNAAKKFGILINQMHMPYPVYIPYGQKKINSYLWEQVAVKSIQLCEFFECPYIVVHGAKLAYYLGTEEREWECTKKFLEFLAPMAKEMGITMCIENLYENIGGHLVEGPCCNVKKAIERIDTINDKYHAQVVGFCFDTGHASLTGLDFEEFITELGERLKVLHIHDNDGVRDLHQIPFTFSRTRENHSITDWNGFIKGLKNIKFDKTLSFETAPVLTTFPGELKKDVLNIIANIGYYFADKIKE